MKLAQVIAELESVAPPALAEPWDNVGLLAGDPAQEVASVILAIDYTREVAAEADEIGADLVIAYHPPIFEPLKRLSAGGRVFEAIRRGRAIYSPHTALDVAEGGTNDVLADALGLVERSPLRRRTAAPTHYKLMTFVPEQNVEEVSRAMFEAGAGWIGNYSCCSFRTVGTGTFFGQKGTSPAVGRPGRLENVTETKVETLVPIEKTVEVMRAMLAAHPYEEPAFDLVNLVAPPSGLGMGRMGRLDPIIPRAEAVARIKRELGLSAVLVAGPTEGEVRTAAVCAGACGDLLDDALAAGSDPEAAADGGPAGRLQAAEIGARIREALAQLSPEHRAVIVLKEIEGMQYHEIADAVGCSIGTVMSRLFYARRRMQVLLKEVHDEL